MLKHLGRIAAIGLAGAGFPLLAAGGGADLVPKPPAATTEVQRLAFAPGGAIRVENSYGYLTVEAWDEPAVELTVTKTFGRFHDDGAPANAESRMAAVRVTAESRSEREIVVTTATPVRRGAASSVVDLWGEISGRPSPRNSPMGVETDCVLRAPRDSRLTIRHDHGYVRVSGFSGAIDIQSHTGDIMVMLPEAGSYSIDAHTGLGSVTSDFAGRGIKQYVAGTKFVSPGAASARSIRLRMGRGDITIVSETPSGPAEAH